MAVTVDKEGKILKCVIDGVQAKIAFDNKGRLVTPPKTTFKTKRKLGEEYGMKKASGIGKEWNEQASEFAKYVTGKTAGEIKGIAVDEAGCPLSSDIKSSVTISIGEFLAALQKALPTE